MAGTNTARQAANKSSTKVIALSADYEHTLALTGGGRIYAWGAGERGRLGTGKEEDELTPAEVNLEERRIKFVSIAAGAIHSLALADDGSVWAWGDNTRAQSTKPCMLEELNKLQKICHIAAGYLTSLAIDSQGALWIWGLYLGNDVTSPTLCRDFCGHKVVKVACGAYHIVALVSAGEVYKREDLVCYSWGNINSDGQLGHGDNQNRNRPEIIKTFSQNSPWVAYEVACGWCHTALLAHKRGATNNTQESTCWTFGCGSEGQLGHGNTQNVLSPELVKGLPAMHLISVDCGYSHTSVVSSAGEVWSWGIGRRGSSGIQNTNYDDTSIPTLISCSQENENFQNPVQIGCGNGYTILVANDGRKLWGWGNGRFLGNGNTIDSLNPTPVLWPELTEDVKDEETESGCEEDESNNKEKKDSQEVAEADEKLKALEAKLSTLEQYVSILHYLIFAKPFEEKNIPTSLQNSGNEWENILEPPQRDRLARLEVYRNMLSEAKNELEKKKILEAIRECFSK